MKKNIARVCAWLAVGTGSVLSTTHAQTLEVYSGQGRFVDAPGHTVGINSATLVSASDGYLYVVDLNGRLIRVNQATGLVTALPATSAPLNHNLGYSSGMALDPTGRPNVYSQGNLHRIANDGTLTNVGPAWSGPTAIGLDGTVYILPGDNRIYLRDVAGEIVPYAGGEEAGFGGDGGPASAALLNSPQGIAVAPDGRILVADFGNHRIRAVDPTSGIITTLYGTGSAATPVNGQHASLASIPSPRSITFDPAGNLYIGGANRILRIDAISGLLTIVGGNGSSMMSGDGGPALSAGISTPRSLAVDGGGNVYFTDQGGGNFIRRISASTGIVSRLVGLNSSIYCGDEGVPAREACFTQPVGLDTDAAGNLLIADVSIQRLRRINAWTRTISTFRQMGEAPIGIEHDANGNLYVASFGQYVVYRIDAMTGAQTIVAGGRGYGYGGDGGPANAAALAAPTDVALDAAGNVYIADAGNSRIRRVDAATGIITTYAQGEVNALEFDGAGNLYFNNTTGCTIRRIDAVTRAISTVVGTGICGSADIPGGTSAATTRIGRPGFTVDRDGVVYVAWYQQIYRIRPSTGILERIPVPGGVLTSPEGLRLSRPGRLELDSASNLYISQDGFPNIYIFKVSGLVDSTPPVITPYVVGTEGTAGWYRSNVHVYFNFSDPESTPTATSSGCSGGWVTEDTAGVTFSCTVTSLGGTATQSITVKRDTVAPALTFGAKSPAPDEHGWNNTDVAFPFEATDALSGVYTVSSPNPVMITTRGSELSAEVTVTDYAGNTYTDRTPWTNIDTTPPEVIPWIRSGTLGNNGWYTSDVVVDWRWIDEEAPIPSEPCEVSVVSEDTAGVTFTCSATSPGGTTTQSVTIKRDATPPSLTFGPPAPAPNASGWFSGPVSFPFTTSDGTSGVATSSESPAVVSGEGTNLTTSVTVTDDAGNSASFSTPPVNIELSPPTVQPVVAGTLGNDGWYTSDVQVSWLTTGNLLTSSGCAPVTVNVDTAGVTFNCSVTSGAGSASAAVTIKRDATLPVLTWRAPTPAPNAAGWNRANVSFPYNAPTDAMSGIASVSTPSPLVVSVEGVGVTASLTVTDGAGNVATFTTTPRNIDKTAPTVNLVTPAHNTRYGLYANVYANYTCTDAVSGTTSCSGTLANGAKLNTRTQNGSYTFRVTSADVAGNSVTRNHTWTVAPVFNFQGYLAPAVNIPQYNLVTPGQRVPMRFRLPDGHGGFVTDPAAVQSFSVLSEFCGSGVVPFTDPPTGPAGLSFDAATSTFTYHWDTPTNLTGCRVARIRLMDGSRQDLQFKFQ